ncbi:MAG: 2-amino-4-hydroxy-6-hydroxymethyldihydropteridine diphosphokinase [Bacteroidales bacterium]|nr:2-amino-4-hydroxy-6-hydroxymethyldihydropteridine diphosphokinase [Bacteroidales bacterium]MCF8456515.1 2-amino-4-hydroxy-6-hydroxymethyldihydropteridine diphosphokinase [Bacteroidales bacterium]
MNSEIFLSLGTNLGDRLSNLRQARSFISSGIGKIQAESSIYESEPWGFDHENMFLNQVIKITSDFPPLGLLHECLEIEKKMGRIRSKTGYDARIIDIDILFYGQEVMDNDKLNVPHPQIQNRAFVLVPLNEITPQLKHPVLEKTISELIDLCEDKLGVLKIG